MFFFPSTASRPHLRAEKMLGDLPVCRAEPSLCPQRLWLSRSAALCVRVPSPRTRDAGSIFDPCRLPGRPAWRPGGEGAPCCLPGHPARRPGKKALGSRQRESHGHSACVSQPGPFQLPGGSGGGSGPQAGRETGVTAVPHGGSLERGGSTLLFPVMSGMTAEGLQLLGPTGR